MKVKPIKLTTCSEGEFTCNDGQCINIEQRLEQILFKFGVWIVKRKDYSHFPSWQDVWLTSIQVTHNLCFSFFWRVWSKIHSCDQTSNCFDESDEDNCKLLFLKVKLFFILRNTTKLCPNLLRPQDNYNKKIAPFSFDKENNLNIPVNINVSMSIIDIIKIEEVDHVYTLKFRLVLEW